MLFEEGVSKLGTSSFAGTLSMFSRFSVTMETCCSLKAAKHLYNYI